MDESRRPADEELTEDKDRGDNSIEGYGDVDRERHPVQVDPGGAPPAREPESGRGRDPELGRVPDAGRVGEAAGR